MDDIHDPTDFRDANLQQIDRVLRCDICKDLYDTPVQLQTCIHSFCALCIRRRLVQERVCPSCKKPADEKKLIRNAVLEECVNAWRNGARQLVITLESGSSSQVNTQPQSQAQSPVKPTPSPPKSRRSARLGKQPQPSYYDEDFQQPSPAPMQPAAASPPPPPPAPTQPPPSPSAAAPANPTLTQDSIVECPLCRQSMKQVVINEHIDRCMNGDSNIPEPPRQFFRPAASSSSTNAAAVVSLLDGEDVKKKKMVNLGKKPVSLVYDMLNTKDLKKTLRELGLSDLGDRQQMVWRHKEYKTLYDANMDSEHPKDAKELRQQLNEAENAYNIVRSNTHAPQVNVEQHNERYKDQFAELIAIARKRQKSSDKVSKEENK